jgi:hypothetical protein
LSTANSAKDYKPQIILLSTWIVELKLNEINKIKIRIESEDKDQVTVENQKLFLAEEEKNFWNFVSSNFKDQREIEPILQNHGKIDECMQSPKGKHFLNKAIDFINKKNYRGALEALCTIKDENERFRQMYKY